MTLKSPRQQQFLKTKLSNGCFKFGEDVETEEELEEKARGKAYLSLVAKMGPRGDA